MACVNLYTVKTALAAEINSMTKCLNNLLNLVFLETTVKGWRIEVETCRSTYWKAVASIEVGHVATVTKLNTSFCTFSVDTIGQFLQILFDLIVDIELTIERNTRTSN